MRPEKVIEHLLPVIDRLSSRLSRGVVVTVREGSVRVHDLPLGEGD
jgi:hypothetical protein